MTLLLVAFGAAVGAPLRYLVDRTVQARYAAVFPYGTLTVNLAGSLLLGMLTGLPVGPGPAALLGAGFCGALTTYSTFGYETLRLAREGAHRYALGNVAANVAAGMGAAAGGVLLARAVTG